MQYYSKKLGNIEFYNGPITKELNFIAFATFLYFLFLLKVLSKQNNT